MLFAATNSLYAPGVPQAASAVRVRPFARLGRTMGTTVGKLTAPPLAVMIRSAMLLATGASAVASRNCWRWMRAMLFATSFPVRGTWRRYFRMSRIWESVLPLATELPSEERLALILALPPDECAAPGSALPEAFGLRERLPFEMLCQRLHERFLLLAHARGARGARRPRTSRGRRS